MGHHRAERRAERPTSKTPATSYVGRRVAGRSLSPDLAENAASPAQSIAPAAAVTTPAQVRLDPTHHFNDFEATAQFPLVPATPSGKRKAVRHAGARGPLFKFLPTAPVAVGIATIAVAIGGAVVSTDTDFAPSASASVANQVQRASALSGEGGVASVSSVVGTRSTPVSRDSRRDALGSVSNSNLVAAAEKQAEQRNAALGQLAQQAEQQAEKIADNQWTYPLNPVVLTARFGQYGLWASSHTGLDFNGETGDQIMSIANGVVTSTGYEGAYGNKTVITLEDGTEIWYAHQTSYYVSAGETVRAGQVIGTVGATGNVTGSHLHVEVRPGGGDPVDPYAAMQNNGLF